MFLAGFFFFRSYGQVWEVPAENKTVKNPSALNNASFKAGKTLYMINCKSCHGDPGKNNALPLLPPPPDVNSEQMQANTDGEIFFKITIGRLAMPAFEATLTEDQRWKIVNYIKSFDPVNKGLLTPEVPVKARLQASANVPESQLLISAEAQDKQGGWGPLTDTEISVKARRTFGYLEVGKAKTNASGQATFPFPKDFPGNKEGMVDLSLSLSEDFSADTIKLSQVKIGSAVEPENIFTHRVLWSTNPRTQWWLILSYIGVVGGVWATIFYIFFLIFKIHKAGKE